MIKNCDITELEAKGAVFFEQFDADGGDISNAADKMIYCGLTNPSEWKEQIVTLTLEKVNDSSGKITCKTDQASQFSCTGGAGGVASYTPTEDVKSSSFSMTATLDATLLTSTVVYRCSVEVGAEDDEKATNTKLIYIQKIRKYQKNLNLKYVYYVSFRRISI